MIRWEGNSTAARIDNRTTEFGKIWRYINIRYIVYLSISISEITKIVRIADPFKRINTGNAVFV